MADSGWSTSKRRVDALSVEVEKIDLESFSQTSMTELPAVSVNVVPLLPLMDLIALGSCSKYLNCICECETIWKEIYKRRWGDPLVVTKGESSKNLLFNAKGWKSLYINTHKKMGSEISKILEEVKSKMIDGNLYSSYFPRERDRLKSLNVKSDDVYFFLFGKERDVISNFFGLYYCLFVLRTPVEDIKKMVKHCTYKKVCIRWKVPENCIGIYLPEEKYSKVITLGEIVENDMNLMYLFQDVSAHSDELCQVGVSNQIPEHETSPCDCEECSKLDP